MRAAQPATGGFPCGECRDGWCNHRRRIDHDDIVWSRGKEPSIRDGTVPDKPDSTAVQKRPPTRANVCRRCNGGSIETIQAGGSVERGKHFVPLCVHPDRDNSRGRVSAERRLRRPRERIKRRHTHQILAVRERETLHRGDADSEAGKRSGTGCDGIHINGGKRDILARQESTDVSRQAFTVRARWVPRLGDINRLVTHERDTAGSSRRVERKDEHVQ